MRGLNAAGWTAIGKKTVHREILVVSRSMQYDRFTPRMSGKILALVRPRIVDLSDKPFDSANQPGPRGAAKYRREPGYRGEAVRSARGPSSCRPTNECNRSLVKVSRP